MPETKTHLELATEVVTAMVNKGYLRIPNEKTEKWEDFNYKAIHTIGWAIEEMYREIGAVRVRAREPRAEKQKPRIITAK